MRKIFLLYLVAIVLYAKDTVLLDSQGNGFGVDKIKEDKIYLFFYPYISTPSILIKHNSKLYSFLSISSNATEYIIKDISTINYKDNKIYFCVNQEVFDLTDNNLTKVNLKIQNNKIVATGISDKKVLKRFFEVNKEELLKKYHSIWSAKRTKKFRKIYPLEDYVDVIVECQN